VEGRLGDAYEPSGLFYGGGVNQLIIQAIDVLIIAAWVAVASFIAFTIIKAVVGIRVSAEEEIEGLDILEHGLSGYAPDTVSA
jgi:Amt family ammonium transporter